MPLSELKKLNQWVCTRATKDLLSSESKIPLDVFGNYASVTNTRTWDSYANCKKSQYPSVGFVLTNDDPYTFIDLDFPQNEKEKARHKLILEKMDSYAEKSISGNGIHIIVKGKIPRGIRRDSVEIYSSNRYMIITENPINNRPIRDCQELLDKMYFEMVSTSRIEETKDKKSESTDEEILEKAKSAANGDKFVSLFEGHWENEYPSQSEADFALISLLAFYSPENEQVMRLFRMSELGKRKKAQRDSYILNSLQKIRSREADAFVDTKEIIQKLEETKIEKELEYPPNLIGEIAQYITESAVRPCKHVGIAASIALCSGLFGRAYNISQTGLNQYIILLAKTGTGKEGAATGIDQIITRVRESIPVIDDYIGPGVFASGQALLRYLSNKPAFISILGEFGITLNQICDPRTFHANATLKRVLLDLYAKSGHKKYMRPSVYADSEKDTSLIEAPSLTILGESTPESFYDGLSIEHIAEGLIPRFLVVEYKGKRPPRNKQAGFRPAPELIDHLNKIIYNCIITEQNNAVINVTQTEDAEKLLDDFDILCDAAINGSTQTIQAQLWNRAHLKVLKLSALLAIGKDFENPIIDTKDVNWAIEFVKKDLNNVLFHFSHGSNDSVGNHRQEHDVRNVIIDYIKMSPAQRLTYKTPRKLINQSEIIPFEFFRRRLRLLKSFKLDRRGEMSAIRSILIEMCDANILRRLPDKQSLEFETKSPLYIRGESW